MSVTNQKTSYQRQIRAHSSSCWFQLISFLFLNFLHRCYRFYVIYSQNLKRMKDWIVSKTLSEIVVRSYWTIALSANKQQVVRNKNTCKSINKILNKILKCWLMIDEVICEIWRNYLWNLLKLFIFQIVHYMQILLNAMYTSTITCVKVSTS